MSEKAGTDILRCIEEGDEEEWGVDEAGEAGEERREMGCDVRPRWFEVRAR
jgi:hypothetical protein